MKAQDVIDEVKLELGCDVLDLEIEDATIEQVIKKALREIERYWDETTLIRVPFASCIDLSGFEEKESCVVAVYRTAGIGSADGTNGATSAGQSSFDPMYAQQWMMFSNGGSMYNLQDYVMNYASWNTVLQIKNTMSTDMSFKEDKHNHKLYINSYSTAPGFITIEYIPKLRSVEDIKSDYWIDILVKFCTALTKTILGRIRTRFTESGALWTQDGDRMLEEGTSELKELREILRTNSNLIFGLD